MYYQKLHTKRLYKTGLIVLTFILIFFSPNGGAIASEHSIDQDSTSTSMSTEVEDVEDFELTSLKLPPLQILLDSAVTLSPERRYALLIADEERINYRSAKINLLQMLSVRASYNYGQIAGNYLQESQIYQPILTYSKTNQDYFNAGVYLSVPIGEILNIRQKKKIMQIRIQRQQEDGERVAREVKISVINEYRKLQLALSNLRAKSDKLNINKTQYTLALNKFEKGVLDIHSLSNISSSYSDARVDYETTMGEVKTCLLLLETITGIILVN